MSTERKMLFPQTLSNAVMITFAQRWAVQHPALWQHAELSVVPNEKFSSRQNITLLLILVSGHFSDPAPAKTWVGRAEMNKNRDSKGWGEQAES